MFRNLYDTDCITWSPQGRIFQVEYAMQAVVQGTCCVGLRSKTHVVLCSLRRTTSKLAGAQQKLFRIDENIGVAISGITADAKAMREMMINECLYHRYFYDSEKPVGRLALLVADKCQANTQKSGKRPFGVGLLIGGVDSTGPHIFETCPSGNYYEYQAMAFGSRSQASRTYLERHFESLNDCSVEELEVHSLKALKASLAAETELTVDTVSMAVVGIGCPWKELTEDEIKHLLIQMGNGDGEAMATD